MYLVTFTVQKKNKTQTVVTVWSCSSVVWPQWRCCSSYTASVCYLHFNCTGGRGALIYCARPAARLQCCSSQLSSSGLDVRDALMRDITRAGVSHSGLDLLLTVSTDFNHIITAQWLIPVSVYNWHSIHHCMDLHTCQCHSRFFLIWLI